MSNNEPPSFYNPQPSWGDQPYSNYDGPQPGYHQQQQQPGYGPQMGYQQQQQQPGYGPQMGYQQQQQQPGYGPQMGYQQQAYYVVPIFDPWRGKATAGLILGIVSLVLWFIPFVGAISCIVCAILGIVFSSQGLRSTTNRTAATIGLVLSIIAVVLIPTLLLCTLGAFLLI